MYYFTASSPTDFWDRFKAGSACYFSSEASCRNLAGKAWLFFFGYCFGNLFQFLLIQYAEGAVYAVVVQALISPTATIFWTLFKYNEVKDHFYWGPLFNTTTFFTLAGLCLMVPGVIMYNYFSNREAKEKSRVELEVH
ncbi:hypothetical protein KUTeg_002299 [Tegillarca granosa]|uniref:Uncharacterized protein n=1 Tax=Tegillarca granosa TaxID=220873 RepID=A0ABQ9FXI1_TEGGR|nr:hypothetical protein KUTeg_002299 [Tegillarca granosa]